MVANLYKRQFIAQEIGDRFGEGNALWGLALCAEAVNDLPQAIRHAQAALDIFTAIKSPYAQAMRNMLDSWQAEVGN